MKIHGLQKMTLLDYPGRVACTVFLGGCQFRCPYCHNSEILDIQAPAEMEDTDLLKFLEKRRGLLDGVAITGGEPLLRPDLPELIRSIRALGYPIKLDTNGDRPDLLEKMLGEGLLDYVAMDIKNSPQRYAQTVGLPKVDLEPIRRSIGLLIGGRIEYEFRTTVVAQLHDEESFRGIGPMIEGARHYFLQCFTDRDTVAFSGLSAPTAEQMKAYQEIVRPYVQEISIRGMNEASE